MHHPPLHFFDLTFEQLRDWCAAAGMAPFRAAQIMEWVYGKAGVLADLRGGGISEPAAMTNLSKLDRERLAREMTFVSGSTVREQLASDGTRKLLIDWTDFDPSIVAPPAVFAPPTIHSLPLLDQPGELGDGDSRRQTECVMIPADYDEDLDDGTGDFRRKTACISSQVGCPVGCRFCASGIGGLDGNLSAGRIVEQVWRLARQLDETREDGTTRPGSGRITNVVFMGMGEPLANLGNVIRAIRTLAAPWGMAISARKITISTVGLPKAINKLSEQLELPVTLALSLHAPNDALRRELIPWAEYTTIPELLAACRAWYEKTGREITLEYILLRGVNDRSEHAIELAQLARTLRCNVNLIRYNEVRGLPFSRPTTDDVRRFQDVLRDRNVNAHIRASRGRDIAAACGQLRHEAAAV